MCRAGLRHCKPTEAQKRAAAERRKKNRHALKKVLSDLADIGEEELAEKLSSMSPSQAKEHLISLELTDVDGFSELPDTQKKRLSTFVIAGADNPISYGGYGMHDGMTYTDDEIEQHRKEIRDGIIRDLRKLKNERKDVIILSPENNDVTDHIFSQTRWLKNDGVTDKEKIEFWERIASEGISIEGEQTILQMIERLKMIESDDSNARSFSAEDLLSITSDGKPFTEEHQDQIKDKFNTENIDDLGYHPIGDNSYIVMYKDTDRSNEMSLAHMNSGGDLKLHKNLMKLSRAKEVCYYHGLMDNLGSKKQRDIFMNEQSSDSLSSAFSLHDISVFKSMFFKSSVYSEHSLSQKNLTYELYASHNYYNDQFPEYYENYLPEKPTVDDFRLFSAGMQVNDDKKMKISDDVKKKHFPENGDIQEIDDYEESKKFFDYVVKNSNEDLLSNKTVLAIENYTGSGYTNFINVSKGIPLVGNISNYDRYAVSQVHEASRSIHYYAKANPTTKYLRRTIMPPFGMSQKSFAESLPVGSKLNTTRLTSTTAAYNSGFKAHRDDNVIFHYKTKQGAAVTKIGLDHEREVLIGVNSEFVVVGNDMKGNDLHIYLMDEDMVKETS